MPTGFVKDPAATLDYAIDWTDWLDGDTIASSSWTVPAGLTKGTDTFVGGTSRVFVSGGTLHVVYSLTCQITTTGGRVNEQTLRVQVENT